MNLEKKKMEPHLVREKQGKRGGRREVQLNGQNGNNNNRTGKDTPPEGYPHPLHNVWKFWYFANQKQYTWEQNLRVVKPVSTVEDFWAVYTNIKLPSELRPGCSYFVFKDGLKPMWEDEGNRKGGRWLISFDRQNRSATTVDDKWLEVLLCLIGEAFGQDGEDICGAVVDLRPKFDKINVWTKDCSNEQRIKRIGEIIKERLDLNDVPMTYERHADTQNKSCRAAPMFTI